MNYLNPRHLQAFVSAVELGSMVKASEALHLGQPALSQAISKLESIAGFKLFDRTTRSLSLTPAGKVFYEDARCVLEQNQRLIANINQWSEARRGSVCLMSIPSVAQFLLPRTVRDFAHSHPQIKVDVHDLPDRQLAEQIRLGQGDIAIQTFGFEDENCRSLPLLTDPLRWVAVHSHPSSKKKNIGPKDITDETLIVLRKGSVFREMLEPLLREDLLGVKVIEVDQPSTLLSMVASGVGVALLPALCCPSNGPVINRSWQGDETSRTIVLTRPMSRALMPAPRAFAEFMLSQLEKGLFNMTNGVKRIKLTDSNLKMFLSD
jgi:LysR family carnitine catabolism transcriptional activator